MNTKLLPFGNKYFIRALAYKCHILQVCVPLIYRVGNKEKMTLKGILCRSRHHLGNTMEAPVDTSGCQFPQAQGRVAHALQNFVSDGDHMLGTILLTRSFVVPQMLLPTEHQGQQKTQN